MTALTPEELVGGLPPLEPAGAGRVAGSPRSRSQQFVVAAIGLLFAAPAAVVLWRTVRTDAPEWGTVSSLVGPLWRTVQLAVLVSASAAVIGTLLAFLVVRTDLPGRRIWRVLLVLPLVLPSFVGAAAFLTGLAPGGLLHEGLGLFGIEPSQRVTGLGISWFVLTLFTYPYVLLPVSARLLSLRTSLEESARLLGSTAGEAFRRVTLPQLRPAILGGSLLVFLYSVSEFGAVQLFGYDTLTRVIFATRLVDRSTSFLAASVVVVMAVSVVVLERSFRGSATPDERAGSAHAPVAALRRWTWPSVALCGAVVGLGLGAPIGSLAVWARRGLADGRVDLGDLVEPAWNTAVVAVVAAVVAVAVVLPVSVATTRTRSRIATAASASVVAGFAMPGLVTALALAVITLNTPALNRFYQTTALLIFAYVAHFGSQALAATEQSVRAVPPQLRDAAALLEPSRLRRVVRVELPLMMPGLMAGAGLVLLATAKELPATLLLSPVNFSTLSTEVWASYEDGFYAEAGAASLALLALSAVLTWLLILRRSSLLAGAR